eukprot:2010591-Karenia_brevis.AAC.1
MSLKRSGRNMATGVRKVVKMGLKPSFAYGSKCLGMPDAELKVLRTIMAKLSLQARGSTTLNLAVHSLEPTMALSCNS